ncbi:putative uncharacterized protein DDB_G0286901 [Vespa crabro]|uniref:putative uncharacterized protein DDB_G0286901 n=1 Tax=Vespa crabro TaxID=7445 RepID=UPI001EFF709F|nr:putative uncharacterized protein DDB_G0286901 [Vespa crabro]XP_046823272.1 putative uncharacterized protein DDB_G0286901 [Vespa crabro]
MNNINIHDAIVKVTQIPRTDEDVYFVRLDKPDQSWLDRNINLKNVKIPRNIQLVEADISDISNDMDSKYYLNENEIFSSIKAVNGGINYSNKFLEYQWELKQMKNNLNTENNNANISSSKTNSDYNSDVKSSNVQNIESSNVQNTESSNVQNTESSNVQNTESSNVQNTESSNVQKTKSSNVQNINTDKSRKNIENNEDSHSVQEILKQCKLSRNALILGLLNSKQITTEDLHIPSLKHETFHNQSDLQTEDIAVGNHLIQHPEDPDVYIHPLQLMKKSKDHANLMIDYVGIKEVVTPKQYYINETDNMSFNFIKRNVENK